MNHSSLQPILIRLAEVADAERIVQIQYQALQTQCAKDYTQQQLNALLEDKSRKRSWNETIFVAEINNEIVGFAALLQALSSIGAAYVDPNFTRRGIGTKLLAEVEREAMLHNIQILGVMSSLTARPFYEANGYDAIAESSIRVRGVQVPCIALKKRLIPQTSVGERIYHLFVLFVLTLLLFSIFSTILLRL
ncbi:GNAT family N-acetyltransferase [Lusitaniella coriacea LEGE 07157]|uniref:GNAT family N-acetyltransferase n=1 Tax=Lusitaniella coriacea LEGE 07157 TaxID=945747 RepID=A0A8J7E1B6_9CYAN|nr:GNAT family N-acetyltransferase [Lusitaniella coriacea]MBE9118428.1 GNAT family N-acetyltransferase [Lusitaniella coriacea LEGE 07157]